MGGTAILGDHGSVLIPQKHFQPRHLLAILDLAPFACTVRARSARTVHAGFGGAKRRRNQHVENAAISELS